MPSKLMATREPEKGILQLPDGNRPEDEFIPFSNVRIVLFLIIMEFGEHDIQLILPMVR